MAASADSRRIAAGRLRRLALRVAVTASLVGAGWLVSASLASAASVNEQPGDTTSALSQPALIDDQPADLLDGLVDGAGDVTSDPTGHLVGATNSVIVNHTNGIGSRGDWALMPRPPLPGANPRSAGAPVMMDGKAAVASAGQDGDSVPLGDNHSPAITRAWPRSSSTAAATSTSARLPPPFPLPGPRPIPDPVVPAPICSGGHLLPTCAYDIVVDSARPARTSEVSSGDRVASTIGQTFALPSVSPD